MPSQISVALPFGRESIAPTAQSRGELENWLAERLKFVSWINYVDVVKYMDENNTTLYRVHV